MRRRKKRSIFMGMTMTACEAVTPRLESIKPTYQFPPVMLYAGMEALDPERWAEAKDKVARIYQAMKAAKPKKRKAKRKRK